MKTYTSTTRHTLRQLKSFNSWNQQIFIFYLKEEEHSSDVKLNDFHSLRAIWLYKPVLWSGLPG